MRSIKAGERIDMQNIFNEYYKKYDAWYDNHQEAFLSELAAIKKVLPVQGRGLEIGVGTGRFACALKIANGIDPAAAMVNMARQRGIDACQGTGERLPYQARTFDYVLIVIALCFVQDPLEVLKQAHKVLRENGRIIIGIVDRDSFLGKYYQEKKSVFYKSARFFSVKELTALLEEAQFQVQACLQTISRLPAQMTYVEQPRPGTGKAGFVVVKAQKI